jgi:hypothetical protein
MAQAKLFHARGANYQSLGAGSDVEPPAVAGVEKLAGGARDFGPPLTTDGDNSLKWDLADQ